MSSFRRKPESSAFARHSSESWNPALFFFEPAIGYRERQEQGIRIWLGAGMTSTTAVSRLLRTAAECASAQRLVDLRKRRRAGTQVLRAQPVDRRIRRLEVLVQVVRIR